MATNSQIAFNQQGKTVVFSGMAGGANTGYIPPGEGL